MKNKLVYLEGFKEPELTKVLQQVNSIDGYRCSMNRDKSQIILYKSPSLLKDIDATKQIDGYYKYFLEKHGID